MKLKYISKELNTGWVKALLLMFGILATSIFYSSPVRAEVAASPEAYCTATVGSTGTQVWQNCVANKQAELDICDQDPQPASRAACRENALTYGETSTTTGEESGEGFTPPTSNVDCTSADEDCCIGQDGKGVRLGIGVECSTESDNVVLAYLVGIINFLALGVGIVATCMIIVGGIEYIIAGGVPQKLEKAKSLITNALIALVTFIFMYAILQWLIPGGLF